MQIVVKQALTFLLPLATRLLDQAMWSYTLFGQVEPIAPDLERVVKAAQQFHQQLNNLAEKASSELLPFELDLGHTRHELYNPLNQIIGYSEMLQEIAEDTGYTGLIPALVELNSTAREVVSTIAKTLNEKNRAERVSNNASQAAGLPSAPAPNTNDNAAVSQPNNILIVDDTETNRDILVRRLLREGYETDTAENGREALQKLAESSFDLVLLDIMMPVMDGYEVLQHIKTDPKLSHIPVIVVSALTETENFVRCIELGAEDYLPKPIDPVLLRARIRACLEKKRLRDMEILHLQELDSMTVQLRTALEQVETASQEIATLNRRLEAENIRLNTELAVTQHEFQLASQIQADFLPKTLPDMPHWTLSAYFQPAREVAGDFYDAFSLPNNRLGLVIADVCDKGVGAALFMALTRSFIRALSEQAPLRWQAASGVQNLPANVPPDIAHILQSVKLTNSYIAANHADTGIFATLFFGVLDPENKTLYYINAGHDAPYHLGTGEVRGIKGKLSRTGPAVGPFDQAKYQIASVQLEAGDFLLTYTDGITEAHDDANNLFTEKRLANLLDEFLQKERRPLNATDLIDHILDEVYQHVGQAEPFDDMTILVLGHPLDESEAKESSEKSG